MHDGLHEDIDITNYRMKRLRFSLELLLRTDFADIFEVKAKRVVRKGNISTSWDQEKTELISVYEHNGFSTSMITRLIHSSSVPIYNNGRVSFPIDLAPKAIWHSCCQYMMDVAETKKEFHECVHSLRTPESEVESDLRDSPRSLAEAQLGVCTKPVAKDR